MDYQQAIKKLEAIRDHPNTSDTEKAAMAAKILELRNKHPDTKDEPFNTFSFKTSTIWDMDVTWSPGKVYVADLDDIIDVEYKYGDTDDG